MKRRILLSLAAVGGLLSACGTSEENQSTATGSATAKAKNFTTEKYTMPSEEATHDSTWVAYVADPDIWGKDLADTVKENLATIASSIARFEPVHLAVNPDDYEQAQEIFADNPQITLHQIALDDLWLRDSAPVFVYDKDQKISGVNFNFNGWGNKQEHGQDSKVAERINEIVGTPNIATSLVLEGGSIEVDGAGSVILTESSVLNDNRNPGWSKEDVEKELGALLGVQNFIWIPGIKGKDITDGHTDFYARFAGEDTIVASIDNDKESFDYDVTRKNIEILKQAKKPDGSPYKVVELPAPVDIREDFLTDDFAAGYINYYVCNGAIIMPEFGDEEADTFAFDTLQELFPEHEIVQINIDAIAAGGGGIHCATQQQILKK